MRVAEKTAVNLCTGTNQVAIVTKDEDGNYGVDLLHKKSDADSIYHKLPYLFRELTKKILGHSK